MPVINIYMPKGTDLKSEVLNSISHEITQLLQLPPNHVWIFVHTVEKFIKYEWENNENTPVVMVNCKNTYTQQQVESVIRIISSQLNEACDCGEDKVYISVMRIQPNHLYVRGEIWSE